MRNAGSGRALTFSLLALAALAAAASAGCVKTAASAADASSEEAEASSGGMYMVPHLGKNPVLRPVTGAPPGKLVHVPLSAPSVSVRRKDEPVTQPRLPEKRSVQKAPPDDNERYYKALLEAAERRRPRKQHVGTRSYA